MHLRALTLRGFKSFADKTRLDFEPGITVVVGPNGSGKSNVVDALTWVLGSHSAKSLRGGSMSDVIFAGSGERPALGRAAVDITIDNTAGVLPVDYSEVTVSRAMFASGENDYAINGEGCRMLDVAELLNDSGLGREHHTIIGQGKIDAVLNAKPEERRAFIEEAAGILKHRHRKDRSLRKLAQTEAHLERLHDVLREVKRNLKPLERQAEAARKHDELAAALTEVRAARALRELDALTRRLDDQQAGAHASEETLRGLERELASARADESRLERDLGRVAPRTRSASQTHFRLANLVERYRGLGERIQERRHGLSEAVDEPVTGRDPDRLRAEAADEGRRVDALTEDVAQARARLEAAERSRAESERARRAHDQATAAEARRRAQARERRIRLQGETTAVRSMLSQATSEQGRLAGRLSGLRARRGELGDEVEQARAEVERHEAEAPALARTLESAQAAAERWRSAAASAAGTERELEHRRAALEARADALRAASQPVTGGAAALLEAAEAGHIHGVLGPLADRLEVSEGWAAAAAAALGPLGDALVAASAGDAAGAVRHARATDAGRVLLVPRASRPSGGSADRDRALAAEGARPLCELLAGDQEVVWGLAPALAGVYGVDDYRTATRLAGTHPECVFVTVDGELAGAAGYAGGSAGPSGTVLSRAAADRAEAELAGVGEELPAARGRAEQAQQSLAEARAEVEAAAAAVHTCEAGRAAASERLARLAQEMDSCESELAGVGRQADDLAVQIHSQQERLAALEADETDEEPLEARDDGADVEAERLEDAVAEQREAEVEARLAVSAAEQERAERGRRVAALEHEAQDVEQQLTERARRRQERLQAIERCRQLAEVAEVALVRAETSVEVAAAERDRLEEEQAGAQRELGAVRSRLRELEERLVQMRDARHRNDLARQELEAAVAAVRQRLSSELDADPDAALAAARAAPHDGPLAGGEPRDAELAESEERLARKIGLLGTINPLALDEHAELATRHDFLTSQLDDLRASRRDLQQVIDAVDTRIRDVFSAAFADVAAAFAELFPRMFPGGDGRLVLTDPDDLLDTGVEVEARPPGKRVRRLSLLSGGERSMTALAVLFAIFQARPSPFYVLDEVEAALDDVNLQRFLEVVADFKKTSQLIIVTHQKRTMEVADLLYGVTMQSGGVSKVVSQRMDDTQMRVL